MINETNSTEYINKWKNECPPYPENKYSGVGIVMVAGGNKYYVNAYASIRLLREKGCNLPIEVWRLNKEEAVPQIENELKKYNVEIIDASEVNEKLPEPHTHLHGWECKPFAIIHSKYEEVLFLDADVFVDKDPSFIFATDEYKKYQAIYMPDFNRLQKYRSFWKVFNVKYRDEPEFESGIIFVNKKTNWQALNLCNKICEWGTRFFFNHFHGDKEAFHASYLILNQNYYMEGTPIKKLKGTMLQHFQGEPIFYHRNMKKLSLVGNESVPNFANEDKLFQYVEELSKIYNPFFPQGHGVQKKYNYIRVGLDKRQIEIIDHVIAHGSQRCEKYISIIDDKLNIIAEDGTTTAVLERWEGGWIGRWLHHERAITILEEI